MNSDQVEKYRMTRYHLLEALYEKICSQDTVWTEVLPIAKNLGVTQADAMSSVLYYQEQGWIDRMGHAPVVRFTARGIDHMEDIVLKRDGQRLRLLREFYKLTEGDTHVGLDSEERARCASAAGVSEKDAELAYQWLQNNELLELLTAEHVRITAQGVEEAETSFRHPNEATEHFGAQVVNVTNNYNISGNVGALQSGSKNTANIVQNNAYGDKIVDAFTQLRAAAERLQGEEREEATALIDGIEEQVQSQKPNKTMIKTAGASLKDKLKFKEIDVVAALSLIMNAVHAVSAAGI